MDLLQDASMLGVKPISTPLPKNLKLNNEDGELLKDLLVSRRIIGRLLYLWFRKPDLAYVTQQLNQFVQNPRSSY